MSETTTTNETQKGFLGWVERTGNTLPDPVFIFFYLTLILVAISIVCALLGVSAAHPTQMAADGTGPLIIQAKSMLDPDNIQKLWTDMPKTFTHFPSIGLCACRHAGGRGGRKVWPVRKRYQADGVRHPENAAHPGGGRRCNGMLSNHAADAGYVVMIPLAAIIYAAAGRHPMAGIATAFAGVSGGFSANVSPGQLDALLFGITEAAMDASQLDTGWTMNIAGNSYFIMALFVIYLPVVWFVTDRVVEPRLGAWVPETDYAEEFSEEGKPLTADQKKGLGRALLACLGVCLVWALMTFGPGTPLLNEGPPEQKWYVTATPFFKSLVAAFFVLFLAAGWAYGSAAGTIKNHRDLVGMMTDSMKDMGYYLVLAFACAHFVAMFNWSNLGLISAVHGADAIKASGLPLPLVMGLIVVFAGVLNLFVGSASAKWALLAPVLVPMLLLLGISPEGATAAYRVGDSATNILSPLMVYFPLVLIFAQRWQKGFGIGSLTAMMIPYSIWFMITGFILVVAWIALGIPLGPGAPMSFQL